jgi:hypothetical protein
VKTLCKPYYIEDGNTNGRKIKVRFRETTLSMAEVSVSGGDRRGINVAWRRCSVEGGRLCFLGGGAVLSQF